MGKVEKVPLPQQTVGRLEEVVLSRMEDRYEDKRTTDMEVTELVL